MFSRSLLLALAVLPVLPGAALAQPTSSGVSPLPTAAILAPPASPQITPLSTLPLTAPRLTVSGYDRIRVMSNLNYDLDATTPADSWLFFTDMRAWVGLEAAWEQTKLVTGIDLAGTDFDEGALMGFDNPARQRPLALMLRHLYLDWRSPQPGWGATFGRQPARLGNGIVAAINRDAFRVTRQLADLGPLSNTQVAVSAVRGAKGTTRWPDHLAVPPAYGAVQPGMSGGVQGASFTNDPDGSWHELGTYILAYNAMAPGGRLQAFLAQQIDTTQAGVYPSKRYLDLNGEWGIGPLKLGGEGIWLTGLGASAPTTGQRPAMRGYAAYGTATYTLGLFDLGLAIGRGSGDNDPTDGVNTGFQSLFLDEQSFTASPLFGDDLHGFDGTDAGIARGAGLNNITFVQPRLTWRPLSDVTATLGYTAFQASVPQRLGAGVLGAGTAISSDITTDVGNEADARVTWRLGPTTLYGAASTFVPGAIFPKVGLTNAAHKLEVGTEVRF